jgi:hypothetical protein
MVLDKIASLRYFVSNLMVKGRNNMIGAGRKGTSGYVPLCLIFKTLKTVAIRQREESLKATVYLLSPIS